jgi:two-component system, chemotaxis family, chemotaxis protein CheY
MPAAAKIKAVVVDDQLTMRTLVRSSLQQIGITDIRDFAGPTDALVALKGQGAHVIFSDFNMPDMDGLQFLKAVRSDPAMKSTAFILLTGRADKVLVQTAAKLGANNYMVKPFTVATLKLKLEQVFGTLS